MKGLRLAERLNHEYWPWWLIYAPIAPFYLWQALRQGEAAFFTNVNPAIELGGFFGERKSRIYALLPPHSYPLTRMVPAGSTASDVLDLWRASGIEMPLIAKPDVGERGEGVALIRNEQQLLRALAGQRVDMLLQALAPGALEFGIMFIVDPAARQARVLSICRKVFLAVEGDGSSTVKRLLARELRGRSQMARLERLDREALGRIPAMGERILVEPIGNHCRGTQFRDASELATPALESAVHSLLKDAHGIQYGRLDVRADDDRAIQEGRFTIIELNGVSSEPGSIYDPSWSVWRCWRELLHHLRQLGPLSLALQRQGHAPASLKQVLRRIGEHFKHRSEHGLQQPVTPAGQQHGADAPEQHAQPLW